MLQICCYQGKSDCASWTLINWGLYILRATTLSVMTLSTTTFIIMTLNIKGLFVTLSINNTQHALSLCWVSLCSISHFIYCYAMCRYAERRGAILVFHWINTLFTVRNSLQTKLSKPCTLTVQTGKQRTKGENIEVSRWTSHTNHRITYTYKNHPKRSQDDRKKFC